MKKLLSTSARRHAAAVGLALLAGAGLWTFTLAALRPVPEVLLQAPSTLKPQVLDRRGRPLTITYRNHWNLHDRRALHDIPMFLQRAFILAEDKNFLVHSGVDWNARLQALWQNAKAGHVIRGASTITEQIVRMLHPRPRTFWSRWLEGWEAQRLERIHSKADILEFYLNQVPYGANRRGVVQSARHYFDRGLDTLNRHEMLALAVLVRAPSRLDPAKHTAALARSVKTLAHRALEIGLISRSELENLTKANLDLAVSRLPVNASHFVEHVYGQLAADGRTGLARVHTTLDAEIQEKAQSILYERLTALTSNNVHNAGLLVADHRKSEIVAWVSAHAGTGSEASWYDPVTVPRQPGSTLKPFVYAMALEKGWTAATLIDDSPLAENILWGLHDYRNYSRRHYGPIRLRDALGNSLNIPALRAIQYVGVDRFLGRLNELGVHSLRQHPDYYGDGLALGNGEITLLELVGAYATLARNGVHRPLGVFPGVVARGGSRQIFSPEISSLIADILSDADARSLEFGHASVLRFPVQTAIKTGTSSDYRDAWAIAFNHRYTAGVWMGNLNEQRMDHVTGARGPVLVLRSLFAELNRHVETRPLNRGETLVKARICRDTGRPLRGSCAARDEWFRPGKIPQPSPTISSKVRATKLRRPSGGLQLAMDPRIPDDLEAFEFMLEGSGRVHRIEWYIDGVKAHAGASSTYVWPLRRGEHTTWARVWRHPDAAASLTPAVRFTVK